MCRNVLDEKPFMICFDKSIIVNIPLNKISENNKNRSQNISLKYLNDNYLNNKTIDICCLKQLRNRNSVHCELESVKLI